MKHCFKSNEIAHVFVHQSAPQGRVSGGNMSFHGKHFRSYSTDIGYILEYRGKRAFVRDIAGFSNTTYKHQHELRRAIGDSQTVFCVNIGRRWQTLEFTPASLRDYYLAQFHEETPRWRSRYNYVRAESIIDRAHSLTLALSVCTFFGLATTRLDRIQSDFQNSVIWARTILDQRNTARKAAQARRYAARLERNRSMSVGRCNWILEGEPLGDIATIDSNIPYVQRELLPEDLQVKWDAFLLRHNAAKISQWQAGEYVHLDHSLPAYLRREDQELVTSKGAQVPMADAERAFRFAIARQAKGWRRNGEQFAVGPYQLDAINEQGIIAGCHRINWDEIERFAKLEGWI